jgi:hypothetical protein
MAQGKNEFDGNVIALGHRHFNEGGWLRISLHRTLGVTFGKSPSPDVEGSFGQPFPLVKLTDRHAAVLPGFDHHLPKLPPFSIRFRLFVAHDEFPMKSRADYQLFKEPNKMQLLGTLRRTRSRSSMFAHRGPGRR